MKITKKLLKEHRIFNGYDLAKRADSVNSHDPRNIIGVFVTYMPQQNGRLYWPARWLVVAPYIQTDPNAHFMDHKRKAFTIDHPVNEHKEPTRIQAVVWTAERKIFIVVLYIATSCVV